MLRLVAVFTSLLIATSVHSCYIEKCKNGTDICVNEVWLGPLGSLCYGYLGCLNETTPCNGECQRTNPVILPDGQTCGPCEYKNEAIQKSCSECESGFGEKWSNRFWCKEEKKCKYKTETCNNGCPLHMYPIKNGNNCERCYDGRPETSGHTWCLEESRCYDPVNEACNQKCYKHRECYDPFTKTCSRKNCGRLKKLLSGKLCVCRI